MRTINAKSKENTSLSSSIENLANHNASFLGETNMLTLEEIAATNEKYLTCLNLSLSKEFELNQEVLLKNDFKLTKQRIFLKRKLKTKVFKFFKFLKFFLFLLNSYFATLLIRE